MTSETIMVTGTGGGGLGAGILDALPRWHPGMRYWKTLAVDMEPFSWGLYMADHGAIVPPADAPEYLDRIRELVELHDVTAILPGTEQETALLARCRGELPVPIIANDVSLMPLMQSKVAATSKLRELGAASIPWYPWERRPWAIADFGFPLVIKPSRNSSGSRDVYLANNRRELDRLPIHYGSGPMMVQPYIGSADQEYTIGVLSDKDGNIIDSIVIHRALSGLSLRASNGNAAVSTGISQGVIVRRPEMQEFCEDLARRLGSRGPLNLQLRAHDRKFYVFDVHPRFSGTTPIRAAAGFNEPDILLRNWLHGETFGRLDYRTDVAALRTFEHVLVPTQDLLEPFTPTSVERT